MSASDKKATFFPGARKRMTLFVSGTGPLLDKGNQRRIKLGLKMSLADGKLTGMPEWIGDTYSLIAKEGSAADDAKILVNLDGVNVSFFSTDKTVEPSIELESCTLSGFMLSRGKEKKSGELAEVDLYFTLKSNGWVPKLWKWLGDNLNSDFYASFADTQLTLSYVGTAKADDEEDGDAEEPAQGDLIKSADYEAERKDATSPKHDAEFATPPKKTAGKKLSPEAQKAADALDGKLPGPRLM